MLLNEGVWKASVGEVTCKLRPGAKALRWGKSLDAWGLTGDMTRHYGQTES